MKTVLLVGATGAQGSAVATFLSTTNEYHILALTRRTDSSAAKALSALPNVELVTSAAPTGYDTEAFAAAAARADFVFVNTDGFMLGEQAETYWGIRLFQLAARAGVKHLVYSGLDSAAKAAEYKDEFYCGHYEGKARVQEWMHAQKDSKMQWTIIRSGPYIELLSAVLTPMKQPDGTLVFTLPLADGSVPFIHLADFGRYVHWALTHQDRSNHLDFGIATAHVSGAELASTCQTHTGHPSQYLDIPVEHWNAQAWKSLPRKQDTKIGFQTVQDENALLMTYGENFAHWWNLYRASAGNQGLIQRDYAFLDEIAPDRVRSLGEWVEKVKYSGEKEEVLRLQEITKN